MLQTTSIIVSLSIGQWTARRLDKKVTNEVNTSHSASDDAGRYNKLLVSKEHTEAISKIVGLARSFHYENTLAWGDNNERLLPSANYFTYVTKMTAYKADFEESVKVFLSNYDKIILQAETRLNSMFSAKDYPSRAEIVDKFSFKTSFFPVPDTEFRVQLNDTEIQKLTSSLESEINNRIDDAVKDVWNRIKEKLTHMRDKLSTSDAIFRDSMFENIVDLISLLPKLNVTKNQSIEAICKDMRKLVVSPEAVRNNASLRNEKANEVQDILNKFSGFFGK